MILAIMIAVLFASKTKLLFETDKAFSGLMTGILTAITLNMVSTYFMNLWDNSLMNEGILLWLGRLYMFSIVGVSYLTLNYTGTAIADAEGVNLAVKIVYCIPLLLSVLAAPFLGIRIEKNEESLFFYGGYIIFAFLMLMLYLLVGIVLVIRYRKRLEKGYYKSILTFTLLILAAAFFALMAPGQNMLSFVMALALLFVFLEMENPDDYVDFASRALNDYAFQKWGQGLFKNRSDSFFFIISVQDSDYLKKRMGVLEFQSMLSEITQQIQKLHAGRLFRLDSGEFVLVSKAVAREERLFHELLEIIHEISDRYTGFSPESVKYGLIRSVKSYPDMPSFSQNLRFFLKYLHTLSGDVLHVLDEDILDVKNEEDFIVLSLKQAILNNEIMVYYQPIYSTAKQRFTTAEALIRIRDLNGKFMSPELFIPIAEQRGYILALGHSVFENVCRFIREQDLEKKDFQYIEINLSTVQCMQKGLAGELVSIMKEYSISPGFINLEITETAAIHSKNIFIKNMQRLIQLGVSFSLDDYGSGYSNLDYVVQMPFHLVKLDKLLVWDSFEKRKTKILLETSVEMFKNMHIRLVAEGVETMEQALYLEGIGVDFLQGYYFSKPVCEEEFIKIVENNTRTKLG